MDADPPSWKDLFPAYALREVGPSAPPAKVDARQACAEALAAAGLVDFARAAAAEGRSLTLVINDPHRLTDTPAFLDAITDLLDAGLADERVPSLRALVATGSHLSTPEERAAHESAMLGAHAGRLTEIAWHDARDETGLRQVGNHTLNSWMAEGGFYLACGSMEPHYFAGVTGAHKTLTVGVMSMASLSANHEHALSAQARPLKLDGNPVHVGVVDALADLEDSGARLLALNQILVDGHVIAVTAGHPLEALNHGLATVRACFSATLDEPVDLVVAQVQGPLSRDLYQADKGIKNTESAVREDGVLLLEAACPKGVGIDHFVELLRAAPTLEDARAIVQERGYRLGDHKAVRLRALTDERRVHVGVVSEGVPAALGEVLGMKIFPDRASAAAWAREILDGEPARGLVVTDAGNVALEVA